MDGNLDTSLDSTGQMHSLEKDMLWKMALENREGGNKMVKEGLYEQAVGRYSEVIMQLRSLEQETDVKWTDGSRGQVRELRAMAYLNLSLCFLKTEQWTHAVNTATRALQGDKQVVDPKDAVLPPDKKSKALFRRAQAQCEGFGNFDKALEDLKKAFEYTPDDKAIEQMMKKCEFAVKKTTKAADKKMAGFLSKATSDEGLFDESLRPSNVDKKPPPSTEPIKMKDGLWIMPPGAEAAAGGAERNADATNIDGETIDFEELGREIAEMREERPEDFAEIRDKVKGILEKKAQEEVEAAAADTVTAA